MRPLERFYRLGYTFEGNLGRYIYEPLHPADAIRLLRIQPGPAASDINCDLFATRLGERPDYEALSYCWGDEEITRRIRCNGTDFAVTTNLHDALARLRQRHEPRTVWADAICINQRDYAERNRQLLLMKKIYRRATQVAIWLGQETESTGHVSSILRRLRDIGKDTGGTVQLEPNDSLRKLGLPGQTAPAWSALRYFFRRPWFERAWIIQEAVNASDLTVMCGSLNLDWDDIAFTARCLAESPMFATTDTARMCQHVQFVDQRRIALRQGQRESLTLLDLLQGSRRCDATDLRDKVYGLYPLIENETELPPPDYTKPIGVVYRETAAHIIKQSGRLDILGFAGAARHPKTRPLGLPSWVPDWHFYERSAVPLTSVFPSESVHPPGLEVSSDLNLLTVQGLVFDDIASLSDTIQPYQDSIKGERIDSTLLDWPNGKAMLEPTGEQVSIVDAVPDSALKRLNFRDLVNAGISDALPVKQGPGAVDRDIMKLLYGRRVVRTRRGRLGLASSYATAGDSVADISGVGVPFVVRPAGDGLYSLIGECVLHGFMTQGEGLGDGQRITLK